jgi:GAF domain-containing protein
MAFFKLEAELSALFERPADSRKRLEALCSLMKLRVPHYDWFGFYIARRAERILDFGPYIGETFVVDDVSSVSNYLACSLKVKSEILVAADVEAIRPH